MNVEILNLTPTVYINSLVKNKKNKIQTTVARVADGTLFIIDYSKKKEAPDFYIKGDSGWYRIGVHSEKTEGDGKETRAKTIYNLTNGIIVNDEIGNATFDNLPYSTFSRYEIEYNAEMLGINLVK